VTRPESSLPASYFEAKYRDDIDPWRFRTSDYERRKYGATLAALSRSQYRRGLEIGCSIGVMTALLARRCAHLVALDSSATAIKEAQRQELPNVRFRQASLPDQFPRGRLFDLIVCSEVLYYFSRTDLRRIARYCLDALEPGGEIILCHWLGETDYPLPGDEASEIFSEAVSPRLALRTILHDDVYRLEKLQAAACHANGAE
jgi:SAM-dependent methyltransferase